MRRSSPLRALARRRSEVGLIHLMATEHDKWLQRLANKYNVPRSRLAAELGATPGALEHEIAVLINDAALSRARQLIQEREWPDEGSDDLFDRAVYAHWRRFRDAEIESASAQVAETRALLSGERVLVKED